MADVLATLAKLPKMCASVLPANGQVILIKRGVSGYYPAPASLTDADAYNKSKGITEKQVEAMEIGSMFGWDCPGADPDYVYQEEKEEG